MIFLRIIVQLFLFIFPWSIRKIMLQIFFKFKLGNGSKIGYSIVLANKVILEEGAIILNMTFINRIDYLHLKPFAMIGRRNWITGASITNSKSFSSAQNRKCELIIGLHARVVDRHLIDCNGGVYVGNFSTIAGNRSQILTHSIDIKSSTQTAMPVQIGDYCFIGTGCILLMNSSIPSFSVLGAGSTVTKPFEEKYSLYAGNPAKFIKNFDKDYKYFKRKSGNVS
jgi:acetyltransferase-like isoleucine patch superfamily enzyme